MSVSRLSGSELGEREVHWKLVPVTNCAIVAKRHSHASFTTRNGRGTTYVVGGWHLEDTTGKFTVTKLHLFRSLKDGSIQDASYSKEPIKEDAHKPNARWGFAHTHCPEEEALFMHGGFDDHLSYSDTKMFFPAHTAHNPTDTPVFRTLCSDDSGPSPRGYHTSVYISQKSNPALGANFIYTFGGQARVGGWGSYMFFNNVYRLNLSTMVWSLVQPVDMDSAPAPRSQSFAFSWRGRMYVYGGYDGSRVYNDLHVFDPANRKWDLVETKGTNSSGMRGLRTPNFYTFFCRPSGLLVGKNRLVLLTENYETSTFAVYCLDLLTMTWNPMTGRSSLPPYLYGPAVTASGCAFNPPARGNATLARHGSHLYVIGGETRDLRVPSHVPCAHLWQLTLPTAMAWERERLLWLAIYKNSRSECHLAKCPPHIIYTIIGLVNAGAFFLNASLEEAKFAERADEEFYLQRVTSEAAMARSGTVSVSYELPPSSPVKVN